MVAIAGADHGATGDEGTGAAGSGGTGVAGGAARRSWGSWDRSMGLGSAAQQEGEQAAYDWGAMVVGIVGRFSSLVRGDRNIGFLPVQRERFIRAGWERTQFVGPEVLPVLSA